MVGATKAGVASAIFAVRGADCAEFSRLYPVGPLLRGDFGHQLPVHFRPAPFPLAELRRFPNKSPEPTPKSVREKAEVRCGVAHLRS